MRASDVFFLKTKRSNFNIPHKNNCPVQLSGFKIYTENTIHILVVLGMRVDMQNLLLGLFLFLRVISRQLRNSH